MNYIEVVEGSFTRRGSVISVAGLPGYIRTAQKNKVPLYRSYYQYGEEVIAHIKKTGSIAGYGGALSLDRILFDIDQGERDPHGTLELARSFVATLRDEFDIPAEAIQPFFSGRGYHIVIPEIFGFTPGPALPATVRQGLSKLFPSADNIYDGGRIIRCENTINPKSGLYKIYIPLDEFMEIDLDELLERAKLPMGDLILPIHTEFRIRDVAALDDIVEVVTTPSVEPVQDTSAVVTCMQSLFQGGPRVGTRHENILRMTSAYRRGGLPKEAVEILMQSWAPELEDDEVKRTVNDVYEKGYMYGCNDTIMASWCDPKCVFYKKKNYSPTVLNAEDMERSLTRFVKRDFSKICLNMAAIYDGLPVHYLFPGEFALLIGDTGVNKTAWAQNLCVKATHLNILFLSLEVNENLMFRRLLQIAHGLSREQIWEHYRADGDSLRAPLSHIRVMTTLPTIDEIEKTVLLLNPQFVVIDTADCVRVPGATDRLDELGRRIGELAKRRDTIIMMIHHISKQAAVDYETGNSRPLHKHSAKGASALEQQADKVYGIEGSSEGHLRTIRVLKSRDEAFFRLQLRLNVRTFELLQDNQNAEQPRE